MVTSLRTLVLSRAQLRKLRTLGWVVGANASLKWVFNDLSHRWELVPWENFLVSSKPCQTTLTATELLERMPRTVTRNGCTYTLHIYLLRRGAVVYYSALASILASILGSASPRPTLREGILGSASPRPTLLEAAYDTLTEILRLKCL